MDLIPRRAAAVAALFGTLIAMVANSAAWASEFPRGDEGYHSYTELTTEIGAVAALHPDIVTVFSIGKSFQGRDIWAAKVSDNVRVGRTGARGPVRRRHAFRRAHERRDDASHPSTGSPTGTDATPASRTSSTTARSGSSSWSTPTAPSTTSRAATSTAWRKNRQPTPGTRSRSAPDLNRNFGYRWGGGGRDERATRYDHHLSRSVRPSRRPRRERCATFLANRVVDGRQQIRAAISFHENGRLVMWPYGYTLDERARPT